MVNTTSESVACTHQPLAFQLMAELNAAANAGQGKLLRANFYYREKYNCKHWANRSQQKISEREEY